MVTGFTTEAGEKSDGSKDLGGGGEVLGVVCIPYFPLRDTR